LELTFIHAHTIIHTHLHTRVHTSGSTIVQLVCGKVLGITGVMPLLLQFFAATPTIER